MREDNNLLLLLYVQLWTFSFILLQFGMMYDNQLQQNITILFIFLIIVTFVIISLIIFRKKLNMFHINNL